MDGVQGGVHKTNENARSLAYTKLHKPFPSPSLKPVRCVCSSEPATRGSYGEQQSDGEASTRVNDKLSLSPVTRLHRDKCQLYPSLFFNDRVRACACVCKELQSV